MRKIINPWLQEDGYHCFGCDPKNPIGLHMTFYADGEYVLSHWQPQKVYEGYLNTLHGGIQSTLHDEIASWVVYTQTGTAGMTTSMEINYLKPVRIDGGSIQLKAKILQEDRRFVCIETGLYDSANILCSEGKVTYRKFPEQMAREKMHYPGKEAFFADEEA